MKKSTKILSVFMAMLLIFSCIPMSAFAAERNTKSLDDYLANENLANVAETLLTDLGDRSEDIVPTILNLVFQLVPDLKSQAEAAGIDVFNADTEKLAEQLIIFANAKLKEADLNSKLPSIVASIVPIVGIKNLDLSSVDTILQVLVDVGGIVKGKTSMWGDLAGLDVSPLTKSGKTAITTGNSSNLEIIYGLFGFLSSDANIDIIKTVIAGDLSLGSINGTVKTLAKLDLEATVNDMMKGLSGTIKELIYDNLIAEKTTDENGNETVVTAYADSVYASFTSDELLAAALIKLITGTDVSEADAKAATEMTLYELIGTYADAAISKYAITPLNTTVKEALVKLCDSDPQLAVLKSVLNLDYNFTADTFNFADMAKNGIFEGLNDLVCRIIETIVQPSVYTELALKKGGNENITANLTSFFGYVLKTLAGNNGGKLQFTIDGKAYEYDFSGFTAEKISGASLEDMVVAVLNLFFPGWFDAETPASVDTLEEMGAYAAYTAIEKWMPADFTMDETANYKALVYAADGTMKNNTQAQWYDAIATMGMDVACYWLNKATNFGMTQDQAASYLASGWGWEDYLDDIVDWALNYIDGIPAVADELTTERGTYDGYGPFYKLNVILNELIPLEFVNNCNDETFTFDIYTFVMEQAAPSISDCDFKAFADILSKNDVDGNLFNEPVISATLNFVDGLLFAIFEHTCGTPANFTKPATATQDGYEGTYDPNNGHYISATVIPATGEVTPPPETTTEAPTAETTTEAPIGETTTEAPIGETTTEAPIGETTTEAPATEGMLGDVDGNGRITAADARAALRISATLEDADDATRKLADVDKNGKLTAADARIILRVSAGLANFE